MLPFIFFIGILIYFVVRVLIRGFYTVKPDERAVMTSFGRAQRIGNALVTDFSFKVDGGTDVRFGVENHGGTTNKPAFP